MRAISSLILAFGLIALVAAPAFAQDEATGRTVKDSVYTAAQAERGKALFDNICAECHATSEFTDDLFHRAWSTATLFEFYDNLRASMPESAPGSLLDDEYIDAVSFILSLNRFPAGEQPLQPVPDTLMTIMMAMPDSTSGQVPMPRPSGWLHTPGR